MPAIQRYNSERINEIMSIAQQKDENLAILSGKYGLITPEEEIPYYDELLREKDVPELLKEVENFLETRNTEKVIYHTREVKGERKPYFKLIKTACETLGIEFEKKIID